jgi:hypothetical protein
MIMKGEYVEGCLKLLFDFPQRDALMWRDILTQDFVVCIEQLFVELPSHYQNSRFKIAEMLDIAITAIRGTWRLPILTFAIDQIPNLHPNEFSATIQRLLHIISVGIDATDNFEAMAEFLRFLFSRFLAEPEHLNKVLICFQFFLRTTRNVQLITREILIILFDLMKGDHPRTIIVDILCQVIKYEDPRMCFDLGGIELSLELIHDRRFFQSGFKLLKSLIASPALSVSEVVTAKVGECLFIPDGPGESTNRRV